MRTFIKSITLTVLISCLFSCSQEPIPEPQNADRVSINAAISLEVLTRVSEDGTTFTNHDVIKVQNMNRPDKNIASFKYNASLGTWSTDEDLFWAGGSDNVFHAWYPASALYDEFSIPNDQSDDIYVADWMTANKTAKQSDGNVDLTFIHNLAKLTVNIIEWGNEFVDNQKVLTNAQTLSISSVITNNGTAVFGDSQETWIKSHIVDNDSFESIIAPGKYTSNVEILKLFINGSSDPLLVKTVNDITIESGKAYTFNVAVGKDVIILDASSVSVNEWGEEFIEDLTTDVVSQKELGKTIIEDQHIVYNHIHQGNNLSSRDYILSGDSFYSLRPCFLSRVSTVSEIEMKFQMASFDEGVAYLFYSERPFTQNGAILDDEGLKLRWNNSGRNVITNEMIITWEQMRVSPTEKMVLKISVPDQTVSVNGNVISTPGIENFTSIENIFSSYFYERDDGFEKSWLAVPTGSKLYYVKIADVYKGYATQAEYTDGTTQWCWESVYGGVVYQEFSNSFFISYGVSEVSYRASLWDHFDGANDNDYIDEYGINHGHGTAIGETVWAPVNCGYHKTDFKYGKLYQWGRKYGQGYNSRLYIDGSYVFENPSYTYQDAIVPSIVVGPVNLQTGCDDDQSNVFFESSSEYTYDWLNPQNNMLWNTGSESKPVKTEYDPCPKGWRVPTYDEINNLSKNTSGLTKNELGQDGYYFSGEESYSANAPQIFLPSAGYRDSGFDAGAYKGNRGVSGYYWSSYCGGKTSRALYFDRSGAISIYGLYRASGYSVRCVRE